MTFMSVLCRFVKPVFYAVSMLPLATLVTFVVTAMYVRLLLGRWPIVFVDNPESPLLTVLCHIAGYLLVLTLYSSFLWFVLLAVFLIGRCWKVALRNIVVYVPATLICLVWFCLFDNTGFIEWFLD